MTPAEAYEVILVSQMENPELVARALRLAGIDDSALSLAKHLLGHIKLVQYHLGTNACHPLLGWPVRVEPFKDSTSRVSKAVYLAPMWPQFELHLLLEEDFMVADVRFERPPGAPLPLLQRDEVQPWEIVEADIPRFCQEAFVTESWWPMRTFYCVLRGTAREEFVAIFRFGLLQRFVPWKSEGSDEDRPVIESSTAYHYLAIQ
jgi:hypothetical protein